MFSYCENNPVMYIDPTGHSLFTIVGIGIIIIGIAFGLAGSEPVYDAENSTNKTPIDPNVPPNPESGYVPPKNNPNPNKVKNPNGSGKGWPADNGGVWVPNNKQHGGPGWTVQFPEGGHEHRYPNGKVRTHKSNNSNKNMKGMFIGGAITVGAGIGVIIVLADDTTGVGVIDDASLPVLFSVLLKGVQMVAG